MILQCVSFGLLLQAAPAPPSAEALLQQSRSVIGLSARSRAVESVAGRGRLSVFAGGSRREGRYSWALSVPDKILTTEELDESGARTIRTVGYDGQVMWSAMGATGDDA